MYEVQIYNGTEWITAYSFMDWESAQNVTWALVKDHGWHYVQMVYAPIV